MALGLLARGRSIVIDPVRGSVPLVGTVDERLTRSLVLRFMLRGSNEEMLREAWPGPEAPLSLLISAANLAGSAPRPRLPFLEVSILEQVQDDVKVAMKAGEKDRVGQLRMIVNALQQEEKEGKGDEVAALQRERKRRLDAAESLKEGGRDEQAAAEEAEAELIEGYLPEQLSDDELGELVAAAIEESGASEQKDMGNVMKAVDAEGRRPRRRQARQPGGARQTWLVGS